MKLYKFNFPNSKIFNEENPLCGMNCTSTQDAVLWCKHLFRFNTVETSVIFWIADKPNKKFIYTIAEPYLNTEPILSKGILQPYIQDMIDI